MSNSPNPANRKEIMLISSQHIYICNARKVKRTKEEKHGKRKKK